MKADLLGAAFIVALVLIVAAAFRQTWRRDHQPKPEPADLTAVMDATREPPCADPPCDQEDNFACNGHAPAGRHRRKQYQTGNGVIHASVTDLGEWKQR